MSAERNDLAVEEHLARILATVTPLTPELLPLPAARDRVLAESVRAGSDLPGFDNSAMDGYAVRHQDVLSATAGQPVRLTLIGDLPAGSAANPRVHEGCAVRIMTGAPVPDGADAIVPLEHTDGDTVQAEVAVTVAPRLGAYVRRSGEDARAGELLLEAGAVLGPRALATAASAGRAELRTHPAPRVGVLSTGDELVPPGTVLRRGQIADCNSYLLTASVAEAGGMPVSLGTVGDDEDALRGLLTDAAPDVDAFLLSGGVSVGAYDVVKAVLGSSPTMRFDRVRMQPGKPQGFGRWDDGSPVFALPGNPVSAFVSFEVFVRPALRRMQGCMALHRPTAPARAAVGWSSPPGRRQYPPAIVAPPGEHAAILALAGADPDPHDHPIVRPAGAGGSGSHLVASLARANALAVVPEGITEVRPGDLIDTVALP